MTDASNTRFSPSDLDGESPGIATPDADANESEASRSLEILCASIAIVLTGAFAVLAQQIHVRNDLGGVDPRWWPTLLGLGGLAISVALLIVALAVPLSREGIDKANQQGWSRLTLALSLTIVYILTWPLVGFIPSTLVFLVAITALFGGRGLKALAIFPISMTVFIYLLFHTLLKVPL